MKTKQCIVFSDFIFMFTLTLTVKSNTKNARIHPITISAGGKIGPPFYKLWKRILNVNFDLYVFLALGYRKLGCGKLVKGFKTEYAKEFVACAVKHRTTRGFESAAYLN